MIGENLPDVPRATNALATKITNPATAKMPPGAKKMYDPKSLVVKRSADGKGVDAVFEYDCTLIYAEKMRDEGMYLLLTAFDPEGKAHPYTGSSRNGYNPGNNKFEHTFMPSGQWADYWLKDGSKIELQLGTVDDEGRFTAKEVLESVIVGK